MTTGDIVVLLVIGAAWIAIAKLLAVRNARDHEDHQMPWLHTTPRALLWPLIITVACVLLVVAGAIWTASKIADLISRVMGL